jgi:hypothetical protein
VARCASDLCVRARARAASARDLRRRCRRTPETAYTQALLLALANPYGFLQGSSTR